MSAASGWGGGTRFARLASLRTDLAGPLPAGVSGGGGAASARLDVTAGSLTYTAADGINNNLTIGLAGGIATAAVAFVRRTTTDTAEPHRDAGSDPVHLDNSRAGTVQDHNDGGCLVPVVGDVDAGPTVERVGVISAPQEVVA